MKKSLLILFAVLTLVSCSNEKPGNLTQSEKEKITKEVELTLHEIVNGWNKTDVNKSFTLFSDSEDFVFIGIDGSVGDYASLIEMSNNMFSTWKSAEFSLLKSHIRIINSELVISSLEYSAEIFYPDSTVEKFSKVGSTFILSKEGDKWIVTHFHESSLAPEIIKPSAESN